MLQQLYDTSALVAGHAQLAALYADSTNAPTLAAHLRAIRTKAEVAVDTLQQRDMTLSRTC